MLLSTYWEYSICVLLNTQYGILVLNTQYGILGTTFGSCMLWISLIGYHLPLHLVIVYQSLLFTAAVCCGWVICKYFSPVLCSHDGQVRHYHIKQDETQKYFISEKHRFPSIKELIEYHKLNGGGLVTRLRRPPNQLAPNLATLSPLFGESSACPA